MLYIEIQLDGKTRVYDLEDALLLQKVEIEAEAACLPRPESIHQAHEFLRAGCFHFEMLETFEHAASWAAHYNGFRAREVVAELGRFQSRRAQVGDVEFVAA